MASAKPAEAHGEVVELATKVALELGVKTTTVEEKSGGTMFGSNIKFTDVGGRKVTSSREKISVSINIYYTGAKGARIEVTVEPQSLVLRNAACMFLRKTIDMKVELLRVADELESSLQAAITKHEGGDNCDQEDSNSDGEGSPLAKSTPAAPTRPDKAEPTTRFRGHKHVNVHSSQFGARMQSGLHGGDFSAAMQRFPEAEQAVNKKMRHKSPELDVPSNANQCNTKQFQTIVCIPPDANDCGGQSNILKGETPAVLGLESGASFWAAFASQVAKELKSSNAAPSKSGDKDSVPKHLVLFGRGSAINDGMTHTLQEIIFGIDKIYAVIPALESVPVIQSAELMRGQGKYPFGVHVSFTTIEECKMVMQAVNASPEGRSVRNPDACPLADVFLPETGLKVLNRSGVGACSPLAALCF
eukprot:g20924.t1